MGEKPIRLSVKAVVRNAEDQYLVIRRSQASKNNAGMWDLPGGKCDPGESMEAALRREVEEETGLHVRLNRVAGSAQWDLPDRTVAYMIMEAELVDGEVQLSGEHDDYQWASSAELTQLEFPPQFCEFLARYADSAQEPRHQAGTEDWYRDQVQKFHVKRPTYVRLAKRLIQVLEEAAHSLGMHAIVQARPKTIASFAEKIQRPGKKYIDPVNELTDLCGARVIAHTLSEVAAFCKFVEDEFEVDWENSGDKSELLGASEFGYLSRHYIVSLKMGARSAKDADADLVTPELKAEIQVRTILQHAWADTAHELSYKNSFKLPRRWQREFARLAAVLEEADRGFDQIATGLKEYASNYGAYFDRLRLEQEVKRHQLVLEADPKNEDVAHQLAKLAISVEDWSKAVEVLRPFAKEETAGVLRDLGISLCKLRRKEVDHSEFQEGQALLKRATELDPTDVDAWASLAGTWRNRENRAADSQQRADARQQAKSFYRRAFEIDHSDPYPLGNYIEYEVADHPDLDVASFFGPSLEAASRRCVAQTQVGVNLPWAYFDLGKFRLLLRRPQEALAYYAKGVDHSTASFFLDSALSSFDTLHAVEQALPGFVWPREFLKLAKFFRFGQQDDRVLSPTPGAPKIQPPVLIVAGYCAEPASQIHRQLFLEGLKNFNGTIISGGTEAGVSALVGELQAAKPDAVHTIGYVPETIPYDDVKLDNRYAELRRTPGDDFSVLEPLQYWADLLASEIRPDQIRMLAVGGGEIAACECQMALALGISTVVIDEAGTAVGRRLAELDWLASRHLQQDIGSPAALSQFVQEESKTREIGPPTC